MPMNPSTLETDLQAISDAALASPMSPEDYNAAVAQAHYDFNLTISAQTPTTGTIGTPENAVIS